MASIGDIVVRLQLDNAAFSQGVTNAQKAMTKFSNDMNAFGSKMTASVTLPIVGLGAAAVKLASDMEETTNKINVAFGTSSGEVMKWSQTSIAQMGLAQQSALDAAALFGDMGTSMGLVQPEASKMSMSLVQLGADLASFKNVDAKQAMTALNGVFTGETESLKMLGIVMTETNLQEFALAQGIKTKVSEMTQAEKVALRYAFVMDKTKNAQGDFARTSGGAANQMRMFQENMKQLGATFGAVILPKVTQFVVGLNDMLIKFQGLSPSTQNLIITLAALAAAIGPLAMGISAVVNAVNFAITAVKGLQIAMAFLAANPVVAVIAIVVALVAALVTLIATNEDVRNKIVEIWNAVSTFFVNVGTSIWNGIVATWNGIADFFTKTIPKMVNDVANWFSEMPGKVIAFYIDLYTVKIPYWIGYAVGWLSVAIPEMVNSIAKWFSEMPGKVGKFFTDLYNNVMKWGGNMLTQATNTARDFVKNMVSFIQNLPTNIGNFLTSAVTKVTSFATNFYKAAGELGSSIYNGIMDWVMSIPEKIGEIFKSIVDSIGGIVKMIADAFGTGVKQGKAAATSAAKTSTTGSTATVKVPAYANGGIVTKPTLALIGEAGPEEVVPLNRQSQRAGGGGNVVINITGNKIMNQRDIDILGNQLVGRLRTAGVM